MAAKRAAFGIGLFILAVSSISAQTITRHVGSPVVNPQGRPVGRATISVCTEAWTGSAESNCTPPATIYSSLAQGQKNNPFQADALGNWDFYAARGVRYGIQFSGNGIKRTQVLDVLLPCPGDSVVKNPAGTQNVVQPMGTELQVNGSRVLTAADGIPGTATTFNATAGPGAPAYAMTGDIDGAKWLTAAGGFDFNLYSDNADTFNLDGGATINSGGRTYRKKFAVRETGALHFRGGRVYQFDGTSTLVDLGDVTIGFGRSAPLTGSAGTIGFPNAICANWRNQADSAEICGIKINISDEAEIGSPSKRTILGSSPVYRGANHVNGSYALSAGWGTTATVAVSSALEKDGAFEVGVTSSGTGQAANPVVTLSFLGGSLPVGTFWRCIVAMNGGTGTMAQVRWFTTNTFLAWTYIGTPVAGNTYFFTGLCASARD